MKIGLILECGPMGAEKKVHPYLARKIRPELGIETVTLDNKPKLLAGCGLAARNLLSTCDRVLIIWDLYPAWREDGEKPCRKEDREAALDSLKAAKVDRAKVALICIQEELEAWLLADERALKKVLNGFVAPHPLKVRIPKRKNPESVRNPKGVLIDLFVQATARPYVDRDHAHKIAEAMPDLKRLVGIPTFDRFAAKLR